MALYPIRILSLCSGVGGLDLGIKLAEPRARTICYVEWEAYAASVLVARMADKILADAPIWDNIATFDGKPWYGKVDCIVGGYPCQSFSVAGKRRGISDSRHIWPDIARIIREVSPTICFFENVPNHLNLGFQRVCENLWDLDYRVETGIFSAAEIGAPHLRKRLFIMAYSSKQGLQRRSGLEQKNERWEAEIGVSQNTSGFGGVLANSISQHFQFQSRRFRGKSWPNSVFPPRPSDSARWTGMPDDVKPAVCRTSNGPPPSLDMRLSAFGNWEKLCGGEEIKSEEIVEKRQPHFCSRADRLRVLGNAVVPQTVALAWQTLIKLF